MVLSRLADALACLAAALLPFCGRGMLTDALPAPEALEGRLMLALLGAGVLLLRRAPLRRWPGGWGLPALLVVGLVSLTPRGGPLDTRFPADLEAGMQELLRLGVLLLLGWTALRARRGWVLAGLLAGGAGSALVGVREYLLSLRGGDPTWRVFAGFVNPNQYAACLLALLPLAVTAALAVDAESAPVRWLVSQQVARPVLKLRLLAGGAGVLLLLALGLTGSKGAVLGLLAGAVVAGVAWARGRGRALLGVAALVAVLGLLGLLGPLRARLVNRAAQAGSADFRVLTWRGTLDLAAQHPWLGCGVGGWPTAYPLYARASFTQHAHQSYLQVLSENGVGGLLVVLALGSAWLWAAWRAAAGTGVDRALGLGVLAALVGCGVAFAVDCGWSVTAAAGVLVMVSGLLGAPVAAASRRCAGHGRGGGAATDTSARRRCHGRAPLVVCALVVLGLLAATVAESARAEALAAARRGEYSRADAALERACAWLPLSGLAREERAGLQAARDNRELALVLYEQARRLRPTSSRVRYRLAAARARWGDLAGALRDAEASVALSPMHLQNRLLLGDIQQRLGQPTHAAATYRELDRLAESPALKAANPLTDYQFEPVHAFALMRLAGIEQAAGRPQAARDTRRRAIPQFEAYLATYGRQEALIKDLPPAERAEILAAQGLSADERSTVERLLDEARVP